MFDASSGRGSFSGSKEAGARKSGSCATAPASCGAFRSSGDAKGLLDLSELSLDAAAGTGPGIDDGVEKIGRASSRKEKVGTAEESATPKAPGMVGAGGDIVVDG
jgi:hypothetical protein